MGLQIVQAYSFLDYFYLEVNLMFEVSLTRNKTKILSFLKKDIIWNSFAICDLEEYMDSLCEWYIAEKDKEIQALCLIWNGSSPPVLHTFGDLGGIESIFSTILTKNEVFLTVPNEHLQIIEKFYKVEDLIQMSRFSVHHLFLEKASKYVNPNLVIRLTEKHLNQIKELYQNFPDTYWDVEQFRSGIFYGVFENEKLIAAIGTHVVSMKFKISAIGNMFILPQYRKGLYYSSLLVANLYSQLKQIGIDHIIWNAQSKSRVAKLYKFWGGEVCCNFVHANCKRKSS